mgnify:CR=1
MKEFFKIFGPVALAIGVIWFLWWKYAENFSTCMAEQGQLGDLFGGVNAIFSGLALAGVVTAVILQSEELKLQREELELQRAELTLSREEFRRMAEANESAALALTRQLQLQIKASRIQGYSALATVSNDRVLSGTNTFVSITEEMKETVAKFREAELVLAINELEKDVIAGNTAAEVKFPSGDKNYA